MEHVNERKVFVKVAEYLASGESPQRITELASVFTDEELAHIIFGGSTTTELYKACYDEAERRDGTLDETVF